MSEIRKQKRDQRVRRLQSLLTSMGLTLDAQATSTSGRWKIYLGVHTREGLPCFDVVLINTDFKVDVHHHWAKGEEGKDEPETYDALRDQAMAKARGLYEKMVQSLQQKGQAQEAEEDKGLKIVNPDGTEEKYTLN